MLKRLIIVITFNTSLLSIAQNTSVGFYAGGNFNNLVGLSELLDTQYKLGSTIGLSLQHIFKSNFFLQADVGLLNKGHTVVKNNIASLSDANGVPLKPFNTQVKTKFNYLSSVLSFGYRHNLINNHSISISLGLSPNYLMSVNSKITTNSPDIQPGITPLDGVKTFDLSTRLSIGYTTSFSDHLSLSCIGFYSRSLLPIFKKVIYEDLKPLHSGFGLNLGINYTLGLT